MTVTRDGRAEPMTFEPTGHGFSARIGDRDVTITSTHVYRLFSTVSRAVNDSGDDFDQFFWEMVDEGWELPILASRATVHLPGRATDGSCGVGDGETDSCPGVGTETLTFTTGSLDPGTSVSVRVDYVVDELSAAKGRPHVVLAELSRDSSRCSSASLARWATAGSWCGLAPISPCGTSCLGRVGP